MKMHECNLPPYLAHDLEAYKKGLEEHSRFLDCLCGELYGSPNRAYNGANGKKIAVSCVVPMSMLVC